MGDIRDLAPVAHYGLAVVRGPDGANGIRSGDGNWTHREE